MKNIKVVNLCKNIKKNEILKNVNIYLEKGKIYGFIGKNGSGKTMLFRSLSGLVKPDAGEIFIDGKKIRFEDIVNYKVGMILENHSMYPEFTGLQNLKYLADINKYINEEQIRQSIVDVGLNPDDKRPLRKYSLGMKQRIIFAQAIMEKPDILFLDEPTNALDDEGVQLIRQLILKQKENGAIVLIASHNKEDIENLCDECYKVSAGEIIREE